MKAIVRSISFDKETLDRLDTLAARKHSNRSQVLREIIADAMFQEGREVHIGPALIHETPAEYTVRKPTLTRRNAQRTQAAS